MGFTEMTFLFVFLPASIVLYLLFSGIFRGCRAGNIVLAVLSLLFYGWAGGESLAVFIALVLFTWMAGNTAGGGKRARIVFPVVCLLLFLVYCKAGALVIGWMNDLAGSKVIKAGKIIVPIGLSFVVFESISYLVDIRRGDAEAGSLLDCLVFLSLFSKLVSGPIVLWKDFRPQLKNRSVTPEKVAEGIDRIIVGYAKKVIIADTFGAQLELIGTAFASGSVDVPTVWLRALLFFFQLYFDFSGYSDIAIGLCRIFGFGIKENFRYPYLSTSVSGFWRRWHISLGTWFREYVYIPLGGSRKGNVYLNLSVVFLLTGLWHGTGLQFLAWGAVHGLCVVLERLVREKAWYRKIPAPVRWFFTMAVVFFAWILFMSESMPDALKAFSGLFAPLAAGLVNFTWRYYLTNRTLILLAVAVCGQAAGIGPLHAKLSAFFNGSAAGRAVKRVSLLLLFAVVILFAVNSSYSPFLYFQF